MVSDNGMVLFYLPLFPFLFDFPRVLGIFLYASIHHAARYVIMLFFFKTCPQPWGGREGYSWSCAR